VSAIRTRLCREDVTEVMAPPRAMSVGAVMSLPICPFAMRNGVILERPSKPLALRNQNRSCTTRGRGRRFL